MNERVPGGNWSPTIVKLEPPRDFASPAFRLQVVNQDAEEFTARSASKQSDLHRLRNRVLTKELVPNLKKLEKVANQLRQEVGQ